MSEFEPSIQERIDRIIEEVGGVSFGAMRVGADGFQASADPNGPVAGYDPVMGKVDRFLKKRKKKKKKN